MTEINPVSLTNKYDPFTKTTVPYLTILLPGGCSKALSKKGPCTMCGYQIAVDEFTKGEKLDAQFFQDFFDSLDLMRYIQLTHNMRVEIYSGGSWADIPKTARYYIGQALGQQKNIHSIFIESRPEFIHDRAISEMAEYWGHKKLRIGFGLEAKSNNVREDLINKGFSLNNFERAVGMCQNNNIETLAYVLLKPFGLSEKQAIEEAIKTILYCFELDINVASLESAFVQVGTELYRKYLDNQYQPPWLWSIVEVLLNTYEYGSIRLGQFTDVPPPIAIPQNYENSSKSSCLADCNKDLYLLFNGYRRGELTLKSMLNLLPGCNCQNYWEQIVK